MNPLDIPLSIEKCLEGPQISRLNRVSQPNLILILTKVIDYAVEMYDSNFAPQVKIMIAKQIIKDFWHLRVDEIAYVFSQGFVGKYHKVHKIDDLEFDGRVYGKVMPVHLMAWIKIYDVFERTDHFHSKHLANKEPYEKQFEEVNRRETKSISELMQNKKKEYKAIKKAQEDVFGPSQCKSQNQQKSKPK